MAKAGFALLEALLVAALLGVGLLGLLGLGVATVQSRAGSRARLQGLYVARDALEMAGLPAAGDPPPAPPGYRLTIIRDPREPRRVTVQVSWPEGAAHPDRLSLTREF